MQAQLAAGKKKGRLGRGDGRKEWREEGREGGGEGGKKERRG